MVVGGGVVCGGVVPGDSSLLSLTSSTPTLAAIMIMGEITRKIEARIMNTFVTFLQP